MRLICPNCGAQYEVADDVIPPAGRDVQCSNCNHTWFERPGASVAEEESGTSVAPVASDRDAAPEPQMPAEPTPAPPVAPPQPDEPIVAADLETYDDEDPDDPLPPPVPPARAAMRTVSPEIAEILRQEAAREEAARRAEADAGVETQPDLGLDALMEDEVHRAEDARRRLARMRGEEDAPPPPAAGNVAQTVAATAAANVATTRRELLPDIEEINSTLRSATDRGAVAAQETARATENQRRGFRLGYGSILLVAAVLGLIYAFAPRIIAVLPQAEPVLVPYVAAIDDARLWLDLKLQGLLTRIEDEPPTPGG